MITSLGFFQAQDVECYQCSCGLASELPQTGHTLSFVLTNGMSLHLGHLIGWTLTRLISMFSERIDWPSILRRRLLSLGFFYNASVFEIFLVGIYSSR